jgi:asparagine synthase (glutamine-hydrolysing)
VTDESLAANFADATFHSEHHNPDLNFIGKFLLSQLPRDHGFKVVLSGEGSDEHFGGYSHFHPDFLRKPDPSWPHQSLTDGEREELAREKEAEVTPGYKGSDPQFVAEAPPTTRRMLNGTSIASHLWAVTGALRALDPMLWPSQRAPDPRQQP